MRLALSVGGEERSEPNPQAATFDGYVACDGML